MKKIFMIFLVMIFSMSIYGQLDYDPTVNGQFVNQQLDLQNMTYSVKVQMNIIDNNQQSLEMESCKIRFIYNDEALEFVSGSVLTFTTNYEYELYPSADGKKIWVEFELNENENGVFVGEDYVDLAELHFNVLDDIGFSNICLFAPRNFKAVGDTVNLTVDLWLCDEYPLPVELTQFTVNTVNNVVTLNWTTATELNNYGFEVERNYNGWQTIGFVQGYGNSNSPKYYSFEDIPQLNGTYQYRLKQLDNDGTYKYSDIVETTINVNQYALYQNYPNPFNPSTTIRYEMKDAGNVQLRVYDTLGNEVSVLVDNYQDAGIHYVKLDASNLASGLYIYKLIVNNVTFTKKMTLLK